MVEENAKVNMHDRAVLSCGRGIEDDITIIISSRIEMEVLLMEEIKLIGNLCLVQITRGGEEGNI